MLKLIGLGLCEAEDISLKGLEEIKKSDKVFMERYTSPWHGKKDLEKITGKKIEEVKRSELEEGSEKLMDEASQKDIALLIPGDPLVATTHIELLIQAGKRNVETEIVHSSSIYSAVAETGLQIYKFGKTTTIPLPQKNYRPKSPYDVIKKNKERGLHTMALLDIKDRPMDVSEALEYLIGVEKEKNDGVINKEERVVAFNVGPSGGRMIYERISELLKTDFPTPAVLIFPGKLHDKEREAMEAFSEEVR